MENHIERVKNDSQSVKRHDKHQEALCESLADKEGKDITEKQKSNTGHSGACVEFAVYGNPVPKERPRVVKRHAYTPAKTKNQETKVALVYKSKYHGYKFGKDIPLRMAVDMYMEIPKSDSKKVKMKKLSGEIRPTKRLDADNGAKLVADALNGVAYEDDAQIVEIEGRKFFSDVPRTEIKINPIGGDRDD